MLQNQALCSRCGCELDWEYCDHCEDGYDGHDCGEDCCMCLYPEENMVCQYCDGRSGWWKCYNESCEAGAWAESARDM